MRRHPTRQAGAQVISALEDSTACQMQNCVEMRNERIRDDGRLVPPKITYGSDGRV